jgi:hypothetical protein
MLRSRTAAFFLCGFITVSAFSMPKWRNQPDQTIDTPVGKFTLTKLRTIHMWSMLSIEGELVNETSKTWDDLYLAMEITDKTGRLAAKNPPNPIVLRADPNASSQLHAHNIPPGAHFKIKVENLEIKADGESLSLAFKYAFGEFPVTYKLAFSKPVASDNLLFTDDNIALVFVPNKTALNFVLQNKGDNPIKIDWNTVSFVSPAGIAQGVIHNGIKLMDKTAPKAPSMIPPRAKVEDALIPVENVEYVENNWVTHPLLPAGPEGLQAAGQEFSIFMPLDLGGTTKNYNFVFKIVAVE